MRKIITFITVLTALTLIGWALKTEAAVTITPATGGSSISADTCNSTPWTTLTGPTIAESTAGEIDLGTIIINAPSGYEFNTSQNVTAATSTGDIVFSSWTVAPAISTITFTVSATSTVSSTVTFSNIQVRPITCTVPNTGNLTFSGTAGVSGAAGTLTMVAGNLASFTVNLPETGVAGSNVSTTITGKDQYSNTTTAGYSADPVVFSVSSGTTTPTSVAVTSFTDDGTWTGNVVFTASGNITLTVTNNSKTGNDTITISPAAISNLACFPSGQAGAVWLTWTVPAGTSNGYEVKYQQGNSITYNSATTFSQTWASGTVGTTKQELVTGLNPNTQYTFAMKAKGGDSTISDQSNAVTCYAPSSSSILRDTTAPTSYITDPGHQSTILAGAPYTIKGTASDTGGSSLQKVEVSLDGGTTWFNATISSEDTGTNRIWQYVWQNPIVGTYTIKSRAYDWVGNIETPSSGITVTVATTLPKQPIATSTPTTTESQPQPPLTTAEAIRAQIVTLQMKLIELLQQLLALLRARLGL